ncbi:MAG: hypothetical protein KA715_10515 [Xanthomonadaceae bacterium]|nr:hypothetical protein [Xanthomonadaceae bacterium]
MNLWTNLFLSTIMMGHSSVWVPSASVHIDKSVKQADYEKGIQLSDAALKTMNIVSSNALVCDERSIVSIKDELFIYRKRENWFKKIPVKSLGSKCAVDSSLSAANDEWVVSGASFVRTAEIESFVKIEKSKQ